MNLTELSPKEKLICNAVITLVSRGADIRSLKVSEIAKAAGVGKGTIYDYFSSKEEIIGKAIISNMHEELDEIEGCFAGDDDFETKVFRALDALVVRAEKRRFSVMLMFISSTLMALDKYEQEIGNEVENCYRRYRDIVVNMLNQGIEQGVISDNNSGEYISTVIHSAFLGFFSLIFNPVKKPSAADVEDAKQNVYKIIVKSLK